MQGPPGDTDINDVLALVGNAVGKGVIEGTGVGVVVEVIVGVWDGVGVRVTGIAVRLAVEVTVEVGMGRGEVHPENTMIAINKMVIRCLIEYMDDIWFFPWRNRC